MGEKDQAEFIAEFNTLLDDMAQQHGEREGQLLAENTRLNERITELERQNGNLEQQLKECDEEVRGIQP